MLARAKAGAGGGPGKLREEHGDKIIDLGLTVLRARSTALVAARDARKLGDEVMREVIEQIDLQEAVLATWEPDLEQR